MTGETYPAVQDSGRITASQISIFAMVVLILAADGLDIQLLAFAAPIILREWAVSEAAFAPALTAALVGMLVGSAFGGWLGDRFGRKSVLLGSAMLFGAATAAASLTSGPNELALLRLVSGLGFGAASPNGLALVTEWLPLRHRARAASALVIATPLGGLVGALAADRMLPELGWSTSFVICGLATVGLAALMIWLLPESPVFLQSHNPNRARQLTQRVIGRATIDPDEPAPPLAPAHHRGALRSVFSRRYARLNIGAWLSGWALSYVTYAILSWGPVLLANAGFSLSEAIRGSLAFNLAGVAGALLAAVIIVRFGSRAPLILTSIVAMAILAMIASLLSAGVSSQGVRWMVFALLAASGACVGLGAAITFAIFSSGYDAGCRATGIGLGLTMARFGGIATTLGGGYLLTLAGGKPQLLLIVACLVLLLSVAGAVINDRHVPPRLGERK